MTEEAETRLVGLRNRVALLYGEDHAQDMFILMLLTPDLTDLQILTKAKWTFRDNLRRESRYLLVEAEFMDMVNYRDDIERIHARIELQRLYNKSQRIVTLIRAELGLLTLARSRMSEIRTINRNEERGS